jgi:hypothetical protein
MKNRGFKSALLFILALSLFIFACRNNSSPVSPTGTKEQLLTQTSWRAQKILEIINSTGKNIDVTNQFPVIYITFNYNGNYCTSMNSGNWHLNNQGTSILLGNGLFYGSTVKMTAEIIELGLFNFNIKISIDTSSSYEVFFTPVNLSSNTSPVVNFDTLWSEFNLDILFLN